MRESPFQTGMSMTAKLMIAITVAFILQQIDLVYLGTGLPRYLALTITGLKHGFVWQFVTFQFLHGGLFHLLGNLLGLWFLGRYLEDRLGSRRLLVLYFASGVVGGLVQAGLMFGFPAHFGTTLMGASAGVCGLLAAFCMLEPHGQILVFFLFPVRARVLLMFALGIALFFTVVPSDPLIAHAAHLGGLLAGIAYIHWALYRWEPSWRLPSFRRPFSSAKVLKIRFPKGGTPAESARPARPVSAEEFISREVDPILEKISAHGIQSLTAREREILEAARARMGKR